MAAITSVLDPTAHADAGASLAAAAWLGAGLSFQLESSAPARPAGRSPAFICAEARPLVERPLDLNTLTWVLGESSDAVMITDPVGVIEYVNPAFEKMTGYAHDEALGCTARILKSGHHDRAFYTTLWSTLRAGTEFRRVIVNRRKNGELFHQEIAIRPLRGSSGRIEHFIASGRDVTDRVEALERLTRAATHDSLTELPNRALFFTLLGQALRQAARRVEGFAVAVIDVDRFKVVNDTLGHFAGDAVLRATGLRLMHLVRRADTVARLGGDEFALILPLAGHAASTTSILDKIARALAVPVQTGDGRTVVTSVSIGGSLYPADGADEYMLMKNADEAMYRAKHAGGNRCRLFGDPI